MSNPKDVIVDAKGMSTHPNDLKLDNGALSVAENVIINRENVIERRRGFKDLSTNLPDFAPTSMFTVAGVSYVVLDNLLWKLESGAWVPQSPFFAGISQETVYGNDGILVLQFVGATGFGVAFNLSTGAQTKLTTDNGITGAWYNSTTGDLYTSHAAGPVGNNIQVQSLTSGTAATIFAGSTSGATGTTDATGTFARFNGVSGLWGDGAGNLYACDTGNSTIRKVTYPGAVVTTYAGTAGSAAETNGTGAAARFTSPYFMTGAGTNIYVTSSTNAIRKIASGAVVTTLAGAAASGSSDGTGTAARFNTIAGISANATDLYVADATNRTVRRVTLPGAVVTTPFGAVGVTASTNGLGTASRFTLPEGVALHGNRLFIGDQNITRLAYLPDGYVGSVFAMSSSLDNVNSSMIYGVNR